MLKVFVGYDSRQPIAYHILCASIHKYAKKPVAIIPLLKSQLPELKKKGLTDFTYTRYLVPMLSGYEGYSVFMDSDMILRADINSVLEDINPTASVSLVPFMGNFQFERPSFMVFNNEKCKNLTVEWLDDDNNAPQNIESWADKIHYLSRDWNYLVGYESEPRDTVKVVHFTQGVPGYKECRKSFYSDEWFELQKEINHHVSWLEIMGRSVHARHVIDRINLEEKNSRC